MTRTKENVNAMAPLKFDLTASTLLGAIAGFFAVIVAFNLNFINQNLFGVTVSPILIFLTFVLLCFLGILIARFIGKYIPFFYKFGKFSEAGGLNWLVDMGVTNLLIMLTGITGGVMTVVFKAISFAVAVTNSYFWNKKWVFWGHMKQDELTEASKFLTASLLGLVFNSAVFSVVKFGGPAFFGGLNLTPTAWVNLGVVVGSLSAMIFNFLLYKIWVFKA